MISYEGFLVKQRPNSSVEFLVFVARAKEIVTWAEADNIKLDRGNVQRELIDSRWRQIQKFFAADDNNVIPTSVTIALDIAIEKKPSTADLGTGPSYCLEDMPNGLTRITIKNVVGSAFIIDGQHRLRGMSELDGEILVPVCLFVSFPILERAFQFVTINNKSHKVPTSNLKALLANFESYEVGLRNRLTQASITAPQFASAVDVLNQEPESPFYKMVNWVNNRFDDGKLLVPPTALENSLRAITRAFPETKEDEIDSILVLYAIWTTVFAEYNLTVANAEEFPNLMMKATIQTVSQMVVDKLASDYDPAFSQDPVTSANGDKVAKTARSLIAGIPAQFWSDEWSLKSLDTSAGRALIEESIRDLKRLLRGAPDLPADWKRSLRLYGSSTESDD